LKNKKYKTNNTHTHTTHAHTAIDLVIDLAIDKQQQRDGTIITHTQWLPEAQNLPEPPLEPQRCSYHPHRLIHQTE